MTFGLVVLGLVVGASVAGLSGALVGGALGGFAAAFLELQKRYAALETRVGELERKSPTVPKEPSTPPAEASPSVSTLPPTPEPTSALPLGSRPEPADPSAAPRAPRTSPVDRWVAPVRDFFLGGNTVVRVGVLVLLVGVSLLVKWATDHDYLSIELRMIGAALIGLALVVVGLRTRHNRPGFAQTLQGGGLAAMYLVIFFSFRTYGLLPTGVTFALLALVAFASGALAVMQDALPLIVIAELGGFMAPVLASTSAGNHVALFGYYILLNLAIFGVAWFKAWRLPNLIGFAFTFGIGSIWGALRYEPEHFWTTEPFLFAFFAIYLAIPVLFALKNPGEKRGWIDGTLVFGTPLATLGLQYALVRDVPFGMAYSTLALAAVYLLVAVLLYRRAPQALRSLAEALLAIGIGFGTLAIPYSFGNHNLTGAAWALEGAGLFWVGVRQSRWLSRVAGAGLQILGWLALSWQTVFASGAEDALPFANTHFVGAFLIGLSSLFVARHAYAHRTGLASGEATALQALIGWGLLFWLAIGFREVSDELPAGWVPGGILVFLAVTGAALELAGRRFDWLPGRYPAALLIPVMGLLLFWWRMEVTAPLYAKGGFIGWPLYIAASLFVLRRFVPDAPAWCRFLHAVFLWATTAFLAMLVADGLVEFANLRGDWWAAITVAVAASLTGAVLSLSAEDTWPFDRYRDVYQCFGVGALVVVLLGVTVWMNAALGADTPPLPYAPILNPVDVAQLIVLGVSFAWVRSLPLLDLRRADAIREALLLAVAAIAFVWFNGALARSVHHYSNVPLTAAALWRSVPFQVSVSVSWSVVGLAVTVWSSRRGWRVPWIVAAVLLGVVVGKLFLIDLAQLSTPAKIGTFLVVGTLLLLVGYFAPVPPARSEASEGAATSEKPA